METLKFFLILTALNTFSIQNHSNITVDNCEYLCYSIPDKKVKIFDGPSLSSRVIKEGVNFSYKILLTNNNFVKVNINNTGEPPKVGYIYYADLSYKKICSTSPYKPAPVKIGEGKGTSLSNDPLEETSAEPIDTGFSNEHKATFLSTEEVTFEEVNNYFSR